MLCSVCGVGRQFIRRIMTGQHAGCVEARSSAIFPQLAAPGVCEFDGRLSLAQLGGTFLLYARANRGEQVLMRR